MKKYDFLVIGGGIAGLTYALEVAPHGSVAVLFKKGIEESSTASAQGGIAAVTSAEDNFDLHVQDTLKVACGLANKNIVEIVISEGPERIKDLIKYGVNFDRFEKTKEFDLHKEGGHSKRRVLHSADSTGLSIQRTIINAAIAQPNIEFFPHTSAIDIITTHKLGINLEQPNSALGAHVLLQNEEVKSFIADKILVATGGAGKAYLYTSNPDVSTGDGIAMCYRAGVAVANMEFFQFHPTCLFHPQAKSFLITEAMRGEGALLRRISGEAFMEKYHPDKELAPRDVVARAIDHEMKIHGEDFVYLDITHKPEEFIKTHFPTITEKCLEFGVDITKDPIPIVPAAHYCCGGVVSDEHGCTTIDNLYAIGECAHTGLHGANRLASNSLLEGVVFAHRAAQDSLTKFHCNQFSGNIPAWDSGSAIDSDEEVIIKQNWDEIRTCLWNYVGIVRSNKRLQRALNRIELIEKEIKDYYWNFNLTSDLLELRNLCLVAKLIVECAIQRKESRGLHFNIDCPETLESECKDSVMEPL